MKAALPALPAVQLPGESEDTVVHAPLGKGFTVHLGHAHPAEGCRPLAPAGAPAQAPAMEGGGPSSEAAERVLGGVSVFNVTIGGALRLGLAMQTLRTCNCLAPCKPLPLDCDLAMPAAAHVHS